MPFVPKPISGISINFNMFSLSSIWISTLNIRPIIANNISFRINLALVFPYISIITLLHPINFFVDCIIMIIQEFSLVSR